MSDNNAEGDRVAEALTAAYARIVCRTASVLRPEVEQAHVSHCVG